ncbi:MAG: hypothetical protein NVS1B9_02000 [Solirubrobacteraceae bacterium]
MRKLTATLIAAGMLAAPAGSLADHPHKARSVARMQCNAERHAIGVKQFRVKYGPDAFRACVKAHLPSDRAAAVQCRAERKSIGTRAFRAKYGRTPLKHCIAVLTNG